MAILIPDEINSRTNDTTSDNDGYFIMIIRLIHQESITTLNIYAPNKITSKYKK